MGNEMDWEGKENRDGVKRRDQTSGNLELLFVV